MMRYCNRTPRARFTKFYPNFTNGPKNGLAKEANIGSPVFGFHPCLVSFSLEHFLSLSLTSTTTFDGDRPGIL